MRATIDPRGNLPIPPELRAVLGLTIGTAVDLRIEGDSLRLVRLRPGTPSRLEDGPAILNYQGKAVSIEQMDEAIAAGAAD